jgi:serine/threonine-protein phosphatase 2A catalytic subunit
MTIFKTAGSSTQALIDHNYMECENDIIAKLERRESLKRDEFLRLLERVTAVLEIEPNIIHTNSPITIIPHLRGDLNAVMKYLEVGGSAPQTQFLFLGHYGNIGKLGPEALCYVLALKEMFPHRVILLRNSMDSTESRIYGLYEALRDRYAYMPIYKAVLKLFSCLPIAAVIDRKVYCGGLSQNLMTLDDISKVNRCSENIYDYGPLEDYFTAIPSEKSNDWFTGNVRLLEYGGNVVKKFCDDNGIELMIRSTSSELDEGHTSNKFYGKIVTIWPGSIIRVPADESGKIETQIVDVAISKDD